MSRETVRGEKYSMAYGVDHLPSIGAFVQVWLRNTEGLVEWDMPDAINLVENHNCGTTGGKNLTEEFVIEMARRYDIPLDPYRVYEVFD